MLEKRNDNKRLLLFCSFGIFVTYFVYGIIQEKITKTKYGPDGEKFIFTLCLVFLQCLVNIAIAKLAHIISGSAKDDVPHSTFALCSLTYIGAMFASNHSLQHVPYPTQVLGKSVKPIPVMIFGVLWAGKRYPIKKYIFVIMITVGVLLFLWKDPQKSSKNSGGHIGLGELLLVASLCLDGLTGAQQEKLRSQFNPGTYIMMYKTNLWSALYLLIAILATSEWMHFFNFAMKYPEVLGYIFLFGLTSAIGQIFIFTTVSTFGPLMCSIVTTTRKFFTILASVILFNNPMASRQWIGTGFVFTGLIMDQLWGKQPKALKTS